MHSTMQQMPENAAKVTYAMCTMHNLLIARRPKAYLTQVSGQPAADANRGWQDQDILDRFRGDFVHRPHNAAKAMRDHLCRYVNTVGKVPWQDALLQRDLVITYIL